MRKEIKIREVCGDWALDIPFPRGITTLYFNSSRNAALVKAVLDWEAAHPNEAVPYSLESSDKKKANKMSNGDRVRRMKDEELARFIMCPNDAGLDEIPCQKNDESDCYECCLA